MSIARVPGMIALGRIPVDVTLIQVSLPDAFGYVSLGISVDIAPAALERARLIIDDGSTLQIGLGQLAHEAVQYLTDRKDLGVHSDVITDAILPLLDAGSLTGACKSQQRFKIVASLALGTKALYDRVDQNPLFAFSPIDTVCDTNTIAARRAHRVASQSSA